MGNVPDLFLKLYFMFLKLKLKQILEPMENSRSIVAKKLAFESQHDVSSASLDDQSTESSKVSAM
jgi:hypothetical protein